MKNQETPVFTTIEQHLKIYGFKKITKSEHFAKYFDINDLDEDGTPKIVTETKTIIVFDNHKYNETYVIDLINNHIAEHNSVKAADLVYCDDPELRRSLFCPNIDKNDYITIENLEKDFLIPSIMIINPIENQLAYFQESIVPFDKIAITDILVWLKIDE